MHINIYSLHQNPFLMKEKDQLRALRNLQLAINQKKIFQDEMGISFTANFEQGLNESIQQATSINMVFHLFGLTSFKQANDIIRLENRIDIHPEAGGITQLFIILAPYITQGTIEAVPAESEESALWRWHFNGKTCTIIYPQIVWPVPLVPVKKRNYTFTLVGSCTYNDRHEYQDPQQFVRQSLYKLELGGIPSIDQLKITEVDVDGDDFVSDVAVSETDDDDL